MKPIRRSIYLFVVLTLSNLTSFCQSMPGYAVQIDSLIQATRPRAFNGVVVVARDGKMLYAKAHGRANFDKKLQLKIDNRFSTMSIAKQITAALILLEVEKGTINLHTPVRKYLANLPYSWADTITMHQLLNNTSGLQADDMSQPLRFAPGREFSYSNIGYALAGQVLEKQSGKRFQQLITELFRKCNMTGSAYYSLENEHLLVKGHNIKEDGSAVIKSRISFPPANFFGSHLMITAPDLVKWNECLHNGKILKPATYYLMTAYTTTAIHSLFSSKPIGYGYGLRINDQQEFKEIGHTGFHTGEGFTAVNLYYPESRTSVVVLENQANENFDIAYYFEQEVRKIVLNSALVRKIQPIKRLRNDLQHIIAAKNATAAISIKNIETNDTLSINGNMTMPMMSVFKFHIALAVLKEVDRGKLQLSQRFFIRKSDLHPGTWSPIRDEYPAGNIYLTLDQLLRYTVSHSDNNGCDLLLDIIGGTKTVQRFIHKQGIRPFTIKVNEQQMSAWDNLYINTTSALATTNLLEKFYKGNVLKPQTTRYLYQIMVETSRGITWMKAGLPSGTELAHRTGISDVNSNNLRAALNDVGIVKLPNGQHFILSVYLKNIKEERAVTEKIIADIAAAAWDYFNRNIK